jgi:hypothetical protein
VLVARQTIRPRLVITIAEEKDFWFLFKESKIC